MNDTNEVKLISVDTPSVEQATEISKLQNILAPIVKTN